jgi:AraC family transcriptional regulator
MIAHGFPDFSLRDHDLDAPCPDVGWPNMLLVSDERQLEWPEHVAPLSFATFVRGRAAMRFASGAVDLVDGPYVAIARGERFSMTVDEAQATTSLHVFFMRGFVESVGAALVGPSAAILDDEPSASVDLAFAHRLHFPDERLARLLHETARVIGERSYSCGWHEEIFHRLSEALVAAHTDAVARVSRLPALRATTRDELMIRIGRAVDLILSAYEMPLTLDAMARAACMSQYHFLRVFRAAFGITPHLYLTRVRLERARTLLATTSLPITMIAKRVGFDRHTSFTTLFRRHVGMAPVEYRQLCGRRDSQE